MKFKSKFNDKTIVDVDNKSEGPSGAVSVKEEQAGKIYSTNMTINPPDSEFVSIHEARINIETGETTILREERIPREQYEREQEEIERIKRENEELKKALKRRRRELPSHLPQLTFQEIRNAGRALSDGPSGQNWEPILGETALRHAIPGEPLETKLVVGAFVDWWESPATYDSLRQELKDAGTPATIFQQILVSNVIKEGTFTIALDEMIKLVGWDETARRNKTERVRCRRQIWRWLLMFTGLQVIGARSGTYRDPDTKAKLDLTSADPFLLIAGKEMAQQATFDNSEPPIKVTIAPGAWIERVRGNRQVLPDYGNVLLLAGIPAEKPSGAWAQSIGLALNQKWREASARAEIRHGGEDNKVTALYGYFTRKELLETFPPRPEFKIDAILNGPHPKRAQEYWEKAIKILERRGVIGWRSKPRIPQSRKGWADAWLNQELDIRPKDEGLQATADISKKAKEVRRARTRKPKISREK